MTNDGFSSGTNPELVKSTKIVQTWRANDWPYGRYSTLTITLYQESSASKLTFVQTGVPSDQFAEISQGWYDYYLDPLKAFVEKAQ